MPRITKTIVLLPCHSLEDFPIHHRGEDAANLLAHWTALWHPALIASTNKTPDYRPADDPELDGAEDSDDAEAFLVVIPKVADPLVSSQLLMNLEDRNAIIVSDQSLRCDIVSIALAASQHAQGLSDGVTAENADDFYALGYAFLQTQIMTRQLRYSSNLDEGYFSGKLVEAAIAATKGDTQLAESKLTECFDLLLEEKNNYYPVEPDLCDIVLMAPTTMGKSLARQLDESHPWNILLTGTDAKTLFEVQPENAKRLADAVAIKEVTLLGGLEEELPFPLMSTESNVNQLVVGRKTLADKFSSVPEIYMRRTFGMTPGVPGVLDQFGYLGAMLATFDEGSFPISSSCNIRWNGDDDRAILTNGEVPLSAADTGSFLGLGVRVGESIDSAHMACFVFVHWPGDWCESFQDLIRCSKFGGLFGSFAGLNDAFEARYDPGFGETYTADEFKSPYLKQAVEAGASNPVSRLTKYWRRFYRLSSLRSLLILACGEGELRSDEYKRFQSEIDSIQRRIETDVVAKSVEDSLIDEPIERLREDLVDRLVSGGARGDRHDRSSAESTLGGGQTDTVREVINTTSSKRRVDLKIDSNQKGTIKNRPPVVICDGTARGSHWVVEVPPMGKVALDPDWIDAHDAFKSDPGVLEDGLLRNEFFELQLDPTTGGIRRIEPHGKRVNPVGQQLAMRIPGEAIPGKTVLRQARYTQMVADKIQQVSHSRLSGSLISSGRLLDGDKVVAEFKQTVSVTRGKRVIDVQIELEPRIDLTHSVNHYLCSRLAWKDESARLNANAQESKHPISSDWFHATHYVEIKNDRNSVALLTGGLPYHRRATRRMLDSLLIVGNEQQRCFEFGIAVNVPYAMAAAVDWMTPMIETASSDNKTDANRPHWLFHFDRKNVMVMGWEAVFDESGNWGGVQIRLRETEGRGGKLAIRCPRPVASGERTNFGGDFLQSLLVAEEDASQLNVEFVRFEYFQITIHWKT